MIGLHDLPEHREAALRYFSDCGATHYVENVPLQKWLGATKDCLAYVSARESRVKGVDKACVPLREFNEVYDLPVTSIDKI